MVQLQTGPSSNSIKDAPSRGPKFARRGSARVGTQSAVRPWEGLLAEVRSVLAGLPHSEVRDRVLQQLRQHGFTLTDCGHLSVAREALVTSMVLVEDELECHPRRSDWVERVALRDARRKAERALWP